MTSTLLETCRIPSAAAAAEELSVPLSFFDIKWLHFHPLRRLLFYDHPCSKPQFLSTVVPQLKHSLSLTLQHYLPVAGNLLYPSDTEKMPRLRYVAGDSVPVTVAESAADFETLTGNHARDADQFYAFLPPMPPIEEESDCKVVPVFAVQVTLFPGAGICIGLSNHHCLGDARSIVGFMSAWAEINRIGGDQEFLSKHSDSLPNFDRSFITDPNKIDAIFWKVMRNIPLKASSFPLPTNRVRSTFILHKSDIGKLKSAVAAPSSFVAAAAYVWSCMVKSGDKSDGDAPELFIIPADARGRTEPPVPANYFGNCIVSGVARAERGELAAEGGFAAAAEAIGGEIERKLNNRDEILKGAENWLSDIWKCFGMSVLGISGSPKFDLLNADFGWGRARKLEVLSIDGENYSMSLCNSRDSDGGLEVGLSLPRERMEAFAAVFADELAKM
ncbi:malonyl-coenzyme:anthocyanin 5-O-glucoside-6'''-O-malonyltransferase-like [Salvia miltiorrhiza]|uniref:malonyl-coenzyme:anthocyanin 5-O-glucoside-6'''-O-malonyltransferase-like n=1 Tax=Salvia miltiorrhiza TaxID=226208 RepID=UPI0025ACE2AD|nr:malonyl-coenzyme:anthocyanin 5-O-glucoside-6'''-O-malonyltransferase-like [Salvia miltiorrhiza]